MVITSKYTSALSATRPTLAISPIAAIPCTTVQKMIGAISMRISRMKASPNGCIAVPVAGAKWPSSPPATIASITHGHSCRHKGRAVCPAASRTEAAGACGALMA